MHLGRSVDQRERWQALQRHLKSARAAMEAGERAAALKHADAALVLDPAFLAAQTLRERIVAMSAASAAAVPSPAVALAELPPSPARPSPAALPPEPTPPRRQPHDLAQLEARARLRRLERRVAAAQQGLAAGHLAEVRAAIDEIKELDPAHPSLPSLGEALEDAERERISAAVERQLPLRPVDHAPGLSGRMPPAADLPLAAAVDTPEPASISASEPLNDPIVALNAPIVVTGAERVPPTLAPQLRQSRDELAARQPIHDPTLASDEALIDARRMGAPLDLTDCVAGAPAAAAERVNAGATRTRRRRSRVVPWLAAAAAFAGVVLAAPWFHRSAPSDVMGERAPVEVAVIAPPVVPTTGPDAAAIDAPPVLYAPPSSDSVPTPAVSPAVAPAEAAATSAGSSAPPESSGVTTIGAAPADSSLVRPVATAPRLPPGPPPAPAETVAAVLPAVAPPSAPQPQRDPSPSLGISPEMPRQLAAAPIPAPPAAAVRPPTLAPVAAANVATRPDDMQLVRGALERYRLAYQDLSAERARAIWPDVNEAALQRAFQALESQMLTFDACDVQLGGSSASAICHGTTQYVPKVGSREPRLEPRVWTFTLQKTGETWQIASARTQR